MSEPKLLEFPCDFPIKIFCHHQPQMHAEITKIIQLHCPAFTTDRLTTRESRNKRYVAFTARVPADSQQQLDDIYHMLTAHPQVVMVL
jgi:putative lipoic acid-binding regulatory protein